MKHIIRSFTLFLLIHSTLALPNEFTCKSLDIFDYPSDAQKQPGEKYPGKFLLKLWSGKHTATVVEKNYALSTTNKAYGKGKKLAKLPKVLSKSCEILQDYKKCVAAGNGGCSRTAGKEVICNVSKWQKLDNANPLGLLSKLPYGATGYTIIGTPVSTLVNGITAGYNPFCDPPENFFGNLHCCKSDNGLGVPRERWTCHTTGGPGSDHCDPQLDPVANGFYIGPAVDVSLVSDTHLGVCQVTYPTCNNQTTRLNQLTQIAAQNLQGEVFERIRFSLKSLVSRTIANGRRFNNPLGTCSAKEAFQLLTHTGCETTADLYDKYPSLYAILSDDPTMASKLPSTSRRRPNTPFNPRNNKYRQNIDAFDNLLDMATLRIMASVPNAKTRWEAAAKMEASAITEHLRRLYPNSSQSDWDDYLGHYIDGCVTEVLSTANYNRWGLLVDHSVSQRHLDKPIKNRCEVRIPNTIKSLKVKNNPYLTIDEPGYIYSNKMHDDFISVEIELEKEVDEKSMIKLVWDLDSDNRQTDFRMRDMEIVYPLPNKKFTVKRNINLAQAGINSRLIVWYVDGSGFLDKKVIPVRKMKTMTRRDINLRDHSF